MRLLQATTAISLLVVSSIVAGAETEDWWDRLQVHGFASQAAIHTSENSWFGDSSQVSYGFTEIGLNASLRVMPRLLMSGQVLVRRAGDMYDGTPALDYGLADLTLIASPQRRLGLRVGRMKNPLGLYNETRDVPFTHPGIFLPQVVYFDRVRNLVLSTDGAMLYGEVYGDLGNLALTVGTGRSVIDENVEWAYLNSDFDGHVKPDNNTWVASLWYSTFNERLKLGLSGATLRIAFDPDQGSPFTLGPGTTELHYGIASFQYNAADWTLSAEYSREPLEWRDYGAALPDRDATGEGWYVQGTYRIRPQFDLMLRYEEGFADADDRAGRGLEALTGGLVPRHAGFSKILSAGIRWDINPHWMVRMEYAYNDGTFILSTRENPDFGAQKRYWNLFSVQAAFRF